MVTDHHRGGYDMDNNEIEIFLSIAAVFQVLYQVNCVSNNFIFALYCICGPFFSMCSLHTVHKTLQFKHPPIAFLSE